MELPKDLTIGDAYGPAMEITEQAKATEYFQALVDRQMQHFGRNREAAEEVERINLGYYAGYYDHETRVRVESLFLCRHPIFGAAAEGTPTAAEALEAGRLRAKLS